MFEVVTRTTKEKKPYKAGLELTKEIINYFNDQPDIILLYCTGHIKSKKDHELLLKGIWEKLSDNTKVIGCDVNGFITNNGCFAKGIVALAIKADNIKVTCSFGKNTKRNPKKAAKQFLKNIKSDENNKFKHKLLVTNISGMEMPKSGSSSPIIKSKIVGNFILILLKIIQKLKQQGFPRDDEILKYISKELSDFDIIYGASGSLVNMSENYQFYNKEVLRESIVGLIIETNDNYFLDYANAAEETKIKLNITKLSKDKHIIKNLNNKPALSEFLKVMNWKMDDFEKAKWIDITSKYPFAYYQNGKIFLRPILMISGDYLGCLAQIEKNNIFLVKMSRDKMVESVDELLYPKKPDFGLFTSCIARQGFLGVKVFQVQEKLKNYFQEKPFLLIYTGGEGIKKQNQDIEYLNETITCTIFNRD